MLPLTLAADGRFIFPSDIVDPSEQIQKETQGMKRYQAERQWIFPGDLKTEKPSPYPKSEHYKYDDFTKYSDMKPKYADEVKRSLKGSDFYSTLRETSHNTILYPSDLEPKKKPKPIKYKSYQKEYDQWPYDSEYPGERQQDIAHQEVKEKIRYIPVPVYNIPGVLPGTVPGLVTPPNMVPGYSHLSPYSSRNIASDKLSGNYNPFTGFGGYPLMGYPMNNLYQNYGSDNLSLFPFGASDLLMPGFSLPEMFTYED
jgi:hypothetical protein